MRRFHSYGPINARYHFCVPRRELVDACINQLTGIDDESGHYFTIWAARQTGKTWLLHQVIDEVPHRYGEQFTVQKLSFGELDGVGFKRPPEGEQAEFPAMLTNLLKRQISSQVNVASWDDFQALFSRELGIWDRPLLLLIDEVDIVPRALLDMLVRRFREMYLMREHYWLHGLALAEVRAVIGAESMRGSPFNIQRSLQVPNLTADEVRDMFEQYQTESGQTIAPTVVEKVYEVTRGQPGLVSWFGALLTETYNPGTPQPIGMETWRWVWHKARFAEPNNTITNLIAKAQVDTYQDYVMRVFHQPDVPFTFHDPIHNYLYMHGIICPETIEQPSGELLEIGRFSSPYVQDCLYLALSRNLIAQPKSVLAILPSDSLDDVFAEASLNLPALLTRYTDYLTRLKEAKINPWKAQPRRETDYQLTEAVGHFHLYAWLRQAIGNECFVSPEFPTGNGRVDIHVQCQQQRGLIEVKSFVDARRLKRDTVQAADYAKQIGLDTITMAVFIPVLDEETLAQLSRTETHDGVQMHVIMIGWF